MGLPAALRCGSGQSYRRGYADNVIATAVCGRKMYRGVMQAVFNGNGGLRGAGAWRLHGKFWEFLGIFERGMGAPLYTPWVCLPVGGGARRADVPQGYALLA